MIGLSELLLILALLSLPGVVALIDVLRHEFSGNNKLIWVVVLLFLPLLGALLYLFIGRAQRLNSIRAH